jgi:hypothetical protein
MMSWSLQVQNGDLAFGSGQMATVTGGQKLVQDLACDILEPMGTDPMHPSFGSTIDGGTQPDGTVSQGMIGTPNDALAASFIYAEIQRICLDYQQRQSARNATDVATYGKSTLTADEALLSVTNVKVNQVADKLLVSATLKTGLGSLSLDIPV